MLSLLLLLFVIYFNYFFFLLGTSVPVERIFFRGTDLIVQKRCSLKDQTIRELMCLKGWYKSGLNN